MQFTKMHGIGNDYVYVNGFQEALPDELATLAIAVSDRHCGIGADGLILILPSEHADVRMRMFNADGSEAEMCGNGLRCVAKYACDHGLASGRPCQHPVMADMLTASMPDAQELRQITVETGRGVLNVALAMERGFARQLCLDMGEPILLPNEIPVNVTGQQAVGVPFDVAGHNLLLTAVSMGNPHAVFFVTDVAAVDLEHVGPAVENHSLFPQKTNVHFVQKNASSEVTMRTWERGSGITLACGTGAAAVCVAGVLASKTDPSLLVHLPGGDLRLRWHEPDNHVYLAGPAAEVFTGHWPD